MSGIMAPCDDLLNSLRDALPRMFADDTNLTLSAKTLTELKLALTPKLNDLSCWLKANRLGLNVAKTELMIIGSRQRLSVQCDDLAIRIDDQIIKNQIIKKKKLSRELIKPNLWVLRLMIISLGVNSLKRFVKKYLRL